MIKISFESPSTIWENILLNWFIYLFIFNDFENVFLFSNNLKKGVIYDFNSWFLTLIYKSFTFIITLFNLGVVSNAKYKEMVIVSYKGHYMLEVT